MEIAIGKFFQRKKRSKKTELENKRKRIEALEKFRKSLHALMERGLTSDEITFLEKTLECLLLGSNPSMMRTYIRWALKRDV